MAGWNDGTTGPLLLPRIVQSVYHVRSFQLTVVTNTYLMQFAAGRLRSRIPDLRLQLHCVFETTHLCLCIR